MALDDDEGVFDSHVKTLIQRTRDLERRKNRVHYPSQSYWVSGQSYFDMLPVFLRLLEEGWDYQSIEEQFWVDFHRIYRDHDQSTGRISFTELRARVAMDMLREKINQGYDPVVGTREDSGTGIQ